ncbi:MAG: hypothetical protein V4596_00370 [Bdellovibrionota bacterium]
MKIFILSVLVIFLNISEASAQSMLDSVLHPVCSKNPLSYSAITNCPKKFPVKAIAKLFDAELDKVIKVSASPNFSELEVFRKDVNEESGEGYTKFQTVDYAFYIKTDKNNKVLQFQQGVEGSDCFYKYKIDYVGKKRFCNAEPVKISDPVTKTQLACQATRARDPIKNPKRTEKSCDVFLEAILSCSKDKKSTSQCSRQFMAMLDKKDGASKPKRNPYNKPMPEIDDTQGTN